MFDRIISVENPWFHLGLGAFAVSAIFFIVIMATKTKDVSDRPFHMTRIPTTIDSFDCWQEPFIT